MFGRPCRGAVLATRTSAADDDTINGIVSGISYTLTRPRTVSGRFTDRRQMNEHTRYPVLIKMLENVTKLSAVCCRLYKNKRLSYRQGTAR